MHCKIEHIASISAIYYALLQSGYEFFSIERNSIFIDTVRRYVGTESISPFFVEVRQSTCEVYPYWPRAAILETAVFCLDKDLSGFKDFASLKRHVQSAANISPAEKDELLWNWITGFPAAVKKIIDSAAFHRYMKWEADWISD